MLFNQVLLQARLSGSSGVLETVAIPGQLYDFRAIRAGSRGYLATGSTHRIIPRIDLTLENEADHIVDLLNGFVNWMLLYVFQGSIFLMVNLDLLLGRKATLRFVRLVLILLLWKLLLLFLELLVGWAVSVGPGGLDL